MKNKKHFLAILFFIPLFANSQNDLIKVDNLLKNLNSNTNTRLDTSDLSPKMKVMLRSFPTYGQKNWTLTTEKNESGSTKIKATSIQKTVFGDEKEIIQYFEIQNGKIININNVMIFDYRVKIKLKNWNDLWDLDKYDIYKEVEKNVRITNKSATPATYFEGSMKGTITIENFSKYEVEDVEILIEHSDINNRPIKTDKKYISQTLKPNGIQDLEWYSTECARCKNQKFTLSFKEN